jgi:organic radical activating enzyme/precorrin-6B methylase 2
MGAISTASAPNPITGRTVYRAAEVYLFDTCTLKCGYCHLAETGKVLKSTDLQEFRNPAYIDRVTAFFNSRTTDSEKWNLMLTGGEPLLMPNFSRFCKSLFDCGNFVSLYTALVVDKNHPSFKFLLDHGAPEVDYIMASFHPEAELQEEDFWERVGLLKHAGHNLLLRFVGHPARLQSMEKVSQRCQELDVCFYPTTLFSDHYPHAYTDKEREQLASHFGSLSQAIQLAGGIDTSNSTCSAGSHVIAVHLPTGEIWPCISVHSPVLGNVYENRLTLFDTAIACSEAGIACICAIHFQQTIVSGTSDRDRFEQQKLGFVPPLPAAKQSQLLKERKLRFTKAPKGIGHVQNDTQLFFPKAYVKEQFIKNFSAAPSSTGVSRPDTFVAARTPERTTSTNHESEDELLRNEMKLKRPAITEGFVMPGFAGKYWIWPEEYALLSKYVDLTDGDYLEIGSMCGIIAMSLAEKHPRRQFVCVDAFLAGHGTIAGERDTFLQNLREHDLKNVTLLEGDSLKIVPTLSRKFQVAFVDGNHAYKYVLGDALNSWRLLSPGGFIIFHDYECVEETTRAVSDFCRQTGARLVEQASSIAVTCKFPEDTRPPETEERRRQGDATHEPQGEIERLTRLLDASESERQKLAEEKERLEVVWQSVNASASWRLLNAWRRARERLAPQGSLPRRLYDDLLRPLRGKH